jgi:hypothetical protein
MATRKKTGGRKKGALNKRTEDVIATMNNRDFDPIEMLIDIAVEAKAEGDKILTFQACKELAQYVAPKRKAMEVTADHNNMIVIENDLSDLQRDNLKKLL